MKLLSGTELAGFIKQRHAGQVRQLLNSGIKPKLAIIQAKDDPVIDTYVRLKKQYSADIGVEVELHKIDQKDCPKTIKALNNDNSVHGMIVQLPLADTAQTDEIVNLVAPEKDVDALGDGVRGQRFNEATPTAILWLLAGYNINLKDKRVLIIGRGRLVGSPLEKILKKHAPYQNLSAVASNQVEERQVFGAGSSIGVVVADSSTQNLKEKTLAADVIIAAASTPYILKSNMIKPGTVVVDAGTASEDGKTMGNVDPEVYNRDDIAITPAKGGVGPLTVCALFENVIRAAQNV